MSFSPRSKTGTLGRLNQIVLGDEAPVQSANQCSVYTIRHWTKQSGAPRSLACAAHRRRRGRFEVLDGRTRLMLIKAQETALNFLVRWFLLEESARNSQQPGLEVVGPGDARPRVASSSVSFAPLGWELHETRARRWLDEYDDRVSSRSKRCNNNTRLRARRLNRSSLLLRDVCSLPDRSWRAIIRFIFHRWLTWANSVELLLILMLFTCFAYQCYELLEDYYQYPTHITVTSVMNDDFRVDLPAVTLCDNNRLSREALRRNFAQYNESHFLAISMGTFYSLNNFTLSKGNLSSISPTRSQLSEWLGEEMASHRATAASKGQQPQQQSLTTDEQELEINWIQVIRHLTRRRPRGHFDVTPQDDSLVDTLICANIWGDQLPCRRLRRLKSIQRASLCHTMFHDTVLWDSANDSSVRLLEEAIAQKPATFKFGDRLMDGNEYMALDLEAEARDQLEAEQQQARELDQMRVDMMNSEMIRMRVNFGRQDYANHRGLVGGRLIVHPNSVIGEISHKSYELKPGYWYTFYIERSDHQRLPPPYNTQCFDYRASRMDWGQRLAYFERVRAQTNEAMHRQAASAGKADEFYGRVLRLRSMGRVSMVGERASERVRYARGRNHARRWPDLIGGKIVLSSAAGTPINPAGRARM